MLAKNLITIYTNQVAKDATASISENYKSNAHMLYSSHRKQQSVLRIHQTVNIKLGNRFAIF